MSERTDDAHDDDTDLFFGEDFLGDIETPGESEQTADPAAAEAAKRKALESLIAEGGLRGQLAKEALQALDERKAKAEAEAALAEAEEIEEDPTGFDPEDPHVQDVLRLRVLAIDAATDEKVLQVTAETLAREYVDKNGRMQYGAHPDDIAREVELERERQAALADFLKPKVITDAYDRFLYEWPGDEPLLRSKVWQAHLDQKADERATKQALANLREQRSTESFDDYFADLDRHQKGLDEQIEQFAARVKGGK